MCDELQNLAERPGRRARRRLREACVKESNRKRIEMYRTVVAVFLAFVCGCTNMIHVSTMHEQFRHFSHLSALEREMSFRSEMGLYYSYYKRLIEAPTFFHGINEIIHDHLVEYPDEINTIQRFNLYPELVLGGLYRLYRIGVEKWGWPGEQCWPVDRGVDLSPVTSCEGPGEPTYFYLQFVWLCAGFTVGAIFIFGYYLSNSILGGLLSVLCFFYNHGEATRVQWTPPLRESFSYPFCLLQMLAVSRALSVFQWKNVFMFKYPERPSSAVHVFLIGLLSWIVLITWQFSQFVICTQIIAVYLMYLIGVTDRRTLLIILRGQMWGFCLAVICLFANKFLVCSLLSCLLVSVFLTLKLFDTDRMSAIRTLIPTVFFTGLFKMSVTFFFGMDDAHIFSILKSKLTSYKDFHTMLYTCAAEFSFMPPEAIKNLCLTLLLPLAFVSFIIILWNWWNHWLTKGYGETKRSVYEVTSAVDADILYTMLQLAAFTIMAILIMRLKLFFTPHLCVLVSVLASRKYCSSIKMEIHWAILAVIIAMMSIKGVSNIDHQRSITGEYSNIPMEQLLTWIIKNTSQDAVFAGPMSVMANVLLSTKRPIVNHPHYEDSGVRERTKKVYTVFSRRPAWQVFEILSRMGVQYVVLEDTWCFSRSRVGCNMIDIWDTEDWRMQWPPVCPTLFHSDPDPFDRLFSNSVFVVLRIEPRQQASPNYVEIVPRKEYKM